jgi:preprotein translocase subunit SecA
MTGTAATEAEEFFDIYKLPVVSVPTNQKMIRKDWNDQIYRTEKEKNKAIIDKAVECNKKGQPVLIGTTSINKSEIYSKLLKNQGIKHSVLNAKHHEKEADIIADAGKLRAITCSTNMAGRGTDIKLGGKSLNGKNEEEKNQVKELGGLFVIGTERHESRRIDNQLRGRSGRQGDQGNSIFFISLEDDLMRIFGSESIDTIMKKFGLKEGESIDHPWINKALERAQQKVEGRNFDIRKTLLKFDDVMNDQRKVIFEQRKKILKSKNITEIIVSFLDDLIKDFSNEKTIYERENQIDAFKAKIRPIMGRSVKDGELENIIKLKNEKFEDSIKEKFEKFRNKRIEAINETTNSELEKRIFLQTVDFLWRSHLQYLDHLRQVVGLRGYAQKDPLEEFRREAFKLFESLLSKIKIDLVTFLNNLEIVTKEDVEIKSSNKLEEKLKNNPKCLLVIKKNEKITRNEKCPSTGKKYKHCCGAL